MSYHVTLIKLYNNQISSYIFLMYIRTKIRGNLPIMLRDEDKAFGHVLWQTSKL